MPSVAAMAVAEEACAPHARLFTRLTMFVWRSRSKGYPSSGDGGGISRRAQKLDLDFDRLYTAMGTPSRYIFSGEADKEGWAQKLTAWPLVLDRGGGPGASVR